MGLDFLNGENIGSLGGELHLALGLIRTHFQAVEVNFHEPIGLFHALFTVDADGELFQMMLHQADHIAIAGDLVSPLLILVLVSGHHLYQQLLLPQTGVVDFQITKIQHNRNFSFLRPHRTGQCPTGAVPKIFV